MAVPIILVELKAVYMQTLANAYPYYHNYPSISLTEKKGKLARDEI
jgi:hypothetical protein